jgi:N-methylhydantoinase A
LCAEGLLAADLRAEFQRAMPIAGAPDAAVAGAVLVELRAEAVRWFDEERVAPGDRSCVEVALMRYEGQGGELAVAWDGDAAASVAAFNAAHQGLYGFVLAAPVELVTLRVEATGRLPAPVLAPPSATEGGEAGTRTVYFAEGTREAVVLDRAGLAVGARVAGPAILTQLDATTLVAPGWTAEVHASGALILRR